MQEEPAGTVPVRTGSAPSRAARQMNRGTVRAGQGNMKSEKLSQQ